MPIASWMQCLLKAEFRPGSEKLRFFRFGWGAFRRDLFERGSPFPSLSEFGDVELIQTQEALPLNENTENPSTKISSPQSFPKSANLKIESIGKRAGWVYSIASEIMFFGQWRILLYKRLPPHQSILTPWNS